MANEVVAHVLPQLGFTPRTILEPTCGKGAFLVAAHNTIPKANLSGYEINPEHVAIASSRLEKAESTIHQANFFDVDWEREIGAMQGPILIVARIFSSDESFGMQSGRLAQRSCNVSTWSD